ncbi:MAG: DUF4340 domain-containing protein [Abitibacteriaceae bacterium]|nr:DUF4340 domain-containing protein [Abditibacteriaceae bacterium]
MKNFASTFILLLVVAAVGGYIYFNERGPVAETGSAVLMRVDPTTLTSLKLTQPGGKTVVLQKAGENWNVQQQGKGAQDSTPAVPADADTVKGLLDQLQLLQSAAAMSSDPAKLKEYGLDKPQSTLAVGEQKVEFGKKPSFDNSKIYARVGDTKNSQVALLPASLEATVTKSFDDWRDKAILRVALDDTTQFDITAPALSATFLKEPAKSSEAGATWKITKPVATSGDTTTVESFINQLPQTKTPKFLDDKPTSAAQWGLDKPIAIVKVATTKGERTLSIGKQLKDGYAAQNSTSPSVFQITTATYGLINRALREWRAKEVVKLELADLTRLQITARNATRNYSKSGDKWQAAGTNAATTNNAASTTADTVNQAVLDTILDIQNLNAQDFIDKPVAPDIYGFDKPAAHFTFTSSKSSGPITVELGSKSGKVYARTGTNSTFSPTVYILPTTALTNFKGPFDTLFGTAKPPAKKS